MTIFAVFVVDGPISPPSRVHLPCAHAPTQSRSLRLHDHWFVTFYTFPIPFVISQIIAFIVSISPSMLLFHLFRVSPRPRPPLPQGQDVGSPGQCRPGVWCCVDQALHKEFFAEEPEEAVEPVNDEVSQAPQRGFLQHSEHAIKFVPASSNAVDVNQAE